MDNDKIITLLNKLINQTKEEKLQWETLSTNPNILKPFDQINGTLAGSQSFQKMVRSLFKPVYNRSYYIQIGEGYFFLVARTSNSLVYDGSTIGDIELIIQHDGTDYSKRYASTSMDTPKTTVLLKRLHNIIESIDPDTKNLIDSFLDSYLDKD